MARYYDTASADESMQATSATIENTPTPTPTAASTSFVTVVFTQTVYT